MMGMPQPTDDQLPPPRGCPICRSSGRQLLHAQRFSAGAGFPGLTGYDVVACAACGLVYADHLPPEEFFAAYYRDASKYEAPDRGGGMSDCDRRRLAQWAEWIAEFLPDPQARILDVGCATGGLLAALKERGYRNLTGLDPSPVCAEAVRALGLRGIAGTIADLDAWQEQFDRVILAGVVEHLREPQAAVQSICRVLAPQGRCLVIVPDANRFNAVDDAPFQEFSIEHINFFSPVSLGNLFGLFGLTRASICGNAAAR